MKSMTPLAGGECGVAHEKRFQMPLPAAGAFWYSFDFGPIHFLQYSTEVPFDAGSEQYRCQHDILRVSSSCVHHPSSQFAGVALCSLL